MSPPGHSTCGSTAPAGVTGQGPGGDDRTAAGGLCVALLARQIVAPGEVWRAPLGALFQGCVSVEGLVMLNMFC